MEVLSPQPEAFIAFSGESKNVYGLGLRKGMPFSLDLGIVAYS